MATCSAGSTGEAADHRVSGCSRAFGVERMGCTFRAPIARAWLDRGANCRNRVSLGRGTDRALRRNRAEFARLPVDLIVTAGTAPVLAAKQASPLVPVVFAIAIDPVTAGLVASLSRPSGNITGLSVLSSDLAGKRLEMLREVIPQIGRLAILTNPENPGAVLELRAVEESARSMGWSVTNLAIRRAEDLMPALQGIGRRVDALYVGIDPVTNASRARINSLALDEGLPTMHGHRGFVETGGLISYGADFPDLWRRAAELVDKILRGAKPADIPVEQPTKFELVINLRTARAFGLTIPPSLLAVADEVIE
jgi:putative tryptophan/tyrosine transport system substrate-binding protein